MTETSLRIRNQAVIIDPFGLHLRLAAKLVLLAKSFRSEVRVICRGNTANAKSILDLATLAAVRHNARYCRATDPMPKRLSPP